MEESEKKLARTMEHLLASARCIGGGNALLFVVAVCLNNHSNGIFVAMQVLLVVVVSYFHFRMDFDRRLFADFASARLMAEEFDKYRCILGLGRSKQAATMVQRCLGALKLLKKAVFLTILQCVVLLLQICIR